MRGITAPAGERTLVFRRRFSSLPLEVEFESATEAGGPPSGTVERVGSRWILGRTTSTIPLSSINRLRKGFWDTFFDIYVIPAEPVTLMVTRPALRNRLLLGGLALLVVAVAAAIVFLLAP
jgi:hypothetical protein